MKESIFKFSIEEIIIYESLPLNTIKMNICQEVTVILAEADW